MTHGSECIAEPRKGLGEVRLYDSPTFCYHVDKQAKPQKFHESYAAAQSQGAGIFKKCFNPSCGLGTSSTPAERGQRGCGTRKRGRYQIQRIVATRIAPVPGQIRSHNALVLSMVDGNPSNPGGCPTGYWTFGLTVGIALTVDDRICAKQTNRCHNGHNRQSGQFAQAVIFHEPPRRSVQNVTGIRLAEIQGNKHKGNSTGNRERLISIIP